MLRVVFVIGILIAATTIAEAGNTTLKRGDAKLRLMCDGTGCFSSVYSNGKWGPKSKLGPGGASNYKRHKAKYQSQGWK